ncbi:MAG TPA: hypothetical protein VK589_20030 [Chryseolinea sp.]|nr:hypothetical protein [Chryseolinea sp.]
MNPIQKDPSQFVSMADRCDQARKHIFPRLMDDDMKFVAGIEIGLLEGLEARLHHKLCDVIENLRKLAYKIPSA